MHGDEPASREQIGSEPERGELPPPSGREANPQFTLVRSPDGLSGNGWARNAWFRSGRDGDGRDGGPRVDGVRVQFPPGGVHPRQHRSRRQGVAHGDVPPHEPARLCDDRHHGLGRLDFE